MRKLGYKLVRKRVYSGIGTKQKARAAGMVGHQFPEHVEWERRFNARQAK